MELHLGHKKLQAHIAVDIHAHHIERDGGTVIFL